MAILGAVAEILQDYEASLPLTVRQVFYRLVGKYGYEKTEQAYSRLAEYLNRARRSGLVAFDAIRDDGVACHRPDGFDDLAGFWEAVRGAAGVYERDLSQAHAVHLELWCEAAGMGPQLAAVAHPYGVAVYSASGFDSLTAKYDAAVRMLDRDKQTVVLHVGDYDPSGVALYDAVREDVSGLYLDLGGQLIPEFLRVAVTAEQIDRYDLPGAPAKATDRRGSWTGDTVQAEALSPDELAAEVTAVLDDLADIENLVRLRRTGERERVELVQRLNELTV